ncbi:MAG: hypothetical protein PUB62_10595 [Prevotellaceae bacterium]|nr:hypothetical protein [Prevotellaceae bacterium]
MDKKTDWEEYKIRTLDFYLRQGGVYGDLSRVLQKARTDKRVLGYMPSTEPAFLLNIASFHADRVIADKAKGFPWIGFFSSERPKDDRDLLFSITYILIRTTGHEAAETWLMKRIGTTGIYRKLLAAHIDEARKRLEDLSGEERRSYEAAIEQTIEQTNKTLRQKEELIDSLRATVTDQRKRIDELAEQVARLTQEKGRPQAAQAPGSELDRMLTLDFIIDHIERKRTHEKSNQLIGLLKDPRLTRKATDEEAEKIEQIEQKMLDASVPSTHNDIRHANVFQAPVHHPTFQQPSDSPERSRSQSTT